MDEQIQQRVDRAAESILENESLTADLNDDAAQVLLDWGLERARAIAEATAGLGETEAEEAMASRLRELRRLMRAVDRWLAAPDAESRTKVLDTILQRAAGVYDDFVPAGPEQRDQFQQQLAPDTPPPQMIAQLRRWLEEK